VRVGTEAEDYVRCLAVGGVSVFDFNTEQYDALEASAVTAVLDDAPIAAYFVERRSALRIVEQLPGTRAAYALAMRKGNVILKQAVDAELVSLESEGTLADLRARWLPQGPPIV